MSKITFRADDDLVRQLEEFDASKSEVMRDALRAYLEDRAASGPVGGMDAATRDESPDGTVDELLADRVDELVESRLEDRGRRRDARDVNVNITLEGVSGQVSTDAARSDAAESPSPDGPDAADEAPGGGAPEDGPDDCQQCGEELSPSSVYCPNCGEKANHRSYCECGDEIRSDWAFCPSCGRRTPAANVLGDT